MVSRSRKKFGGVMGTPVKQVLLVFIWGIILSGCATVKPWEREMLSEKPMLVDPNPIDSAYDDHIYFSLEGSSGGRSFGGGGCGCN